MSGRDRSRSPATGPSSNPRPEGIFLSTERILELIRSTPPPAPVPPSSPPRELVFQFRVPIEKLIDSALLRGATEESHEKSDGLVACTNQPKKRVPFQHPRSLPSKKKKHAGSSSQSQASPQAKPFLCFNCRSPDHLVRNCPNPRRCNYCKAEGHWIASCPRKNRGSRPGNLNIAASSDASQPEGTSSFIFVNSLFSIIDRLGYSLIQEHRILSY